MTSVRQVILAAALAPLFACATESAPPADSAAPATSPPVVAAPSVDTATPPPPPAGKAFTVTPRGIAPLQAGMTIAEARSAAGAGLVAPKGADSTACGWLQWGDGPKGVSVMIEEARIARFDVREGDLATTEGARIGDTEAKINQLYAGRVAVTPHKYTDGHYLTVTPSAPADSNFRIVFETEKGKVTRYRAGRLPPVRYVEGCS